MTVVSDAPEIMALAGGKRAAASYPARTCPECMISFKPHQSNQLFCSTRHRDDWNNRAAIRGRVVTPLAIVSRQTRQGTRGARSIGRHATADLNLLIQRWADEDRAAGRMSHPEYLRRRYRCGFDPIP